MQNAEFQVKYQQKAISQSQILSKPEKTCMVVTHRHFVKGYKIVIQIMGRDSSPQGCQMMFWSNHPKANARNYNRMFMRNYYQ